MSNSDEGIDLENFSKEAEIEKFKGLTPVGWTLAVRLYIKPNIINGVLISDNAHEDQQYKSCVGLVVGVPKGAYLDKRYEHTGEWCKVGDWVVFPRHSGQKLDYDNNTIFFVSEDAILTCVDDPSKITR